MPLSGDYISGEMFERWGLEILDKLDTDFGDRSDGLYNSDQSGTYPDCIWGQGVMFRANNASCVLDPSRVDLTRSQAIAAYMNYRYYDIDDGFYAYNACYRGQNDRYYDDNAWVALAFAELYEITGNESYINQTKEILLFCMSGENIPDDNNPSAGGIRWHESDTSGASVCASAPTTLANLLAYKYTGIESYLEDGIRLYQWLKSSDLYDAKSLYHETAQGVLGYLTGVMTQVALKLYQLTGEQEYLDDAYAMATSMEMEFIKTDTFALTQHGKWGGHDMTDAYVELYKFDGNPRWLNIAGGYLERLYLSSKDPDSGLYPSFWNTTDEFSNDLIDNAAVARSFLRMAQTPGAITEMDYFNTKMIVHLGLNETSGTIANDSSGTGNACTLAGDSFTFDNSSEAGIYGNCLEFDGIDDSIFMPEGFANFRNGLTISLWACPTEAINWARFLDFGNGEYANNIVFARRNTSNDLSLEAYNGSTTGGKVIAENAIELNQWQHFAATIDTNGHAVIYKNGVAIASGTTAVPRNVTRSYNYIGKSNWEDDPYYKGSMDEIKIFNYALSDTDIEKLYDFGGQVENHLPIDYDNNATDTTDLRWVISPLAVSYDIYIGTDYSSVISADRTSPEYMGNTTDNIYTAELEKGQDYFWRIDIVAADGSVSNGHVWTFSTSDSYKDGLLLHYTMDSDFNSEKTLFDSSGSNQINATLKDGAAIFTGGYINQGTGLNGSSAYIELPAGLDNLNNGFSVSMWVMPTAANSWARFIDFGNGAATDNIVIARSGTSSALQLETFTGSSSNGTLYVSGCIEQSKWQMFTITMNGAGFARLYKNGQQIGQGDLGTPSNVVRTKNYIGKSNWSNDKYYKGGFDDFAMWDRQLSSTEVESIYNQAVNGHTISDDMQPFDAEAELVLNEGSGTVAADSSSNNHNGTLVNMADSSWVNGKQCGGLIFDGENDYVEINNLEGILGDSSRTYMAWVNTDTTGFEVFSQESSTGDICNIYVANNGSVSTTINSQTITGTTDISNGNWHYVAVVITNYDRQSINKVSIYIDGTLDTTGNYSTGSFDMSASADIYIGGKVTNSNSATGLIDEVKIYNRDISGEMIQNIYDIERFASDLSGDGVIDILDFAALSGSWMSNETDITCDGITDIDDLMILADEWLAGN